MTNPRIDQSPDQTQVPTVAFTIRPIGIVHTFPRRRVKIPKCFVAKGLAALELFHPYKPGLQGLYAGLELWVITYHALSGRIPTDAWQRGDGVPGVFATATVERPNPIEFLRARVIEINPETGLLRVAGLDVQDGAPILDIRPATSPHHRLTKPGE